MKINAATLAALLTGLLLLAGAPVRAQTITLDVMPVDTTLDINDPAPQTEVQIRVGGLGLAGSPSVAAWDIDLTFDPALLAVLGYAYGTSGEFGLGLSSALTPPRSDPGTTGFLEISLQTPTALDTFQEDWFVLGSVTFGPHPSMALGVSPIGLTVNILDVTDGAGEIIDGTPFAVVTGGSIAVVPEPCHAPLIAAVCALLVLGSRRRLVSGRGR